MLIQKEIYQHGSVSANMQIYPDFLDFFQTSNSKYKPGQVYTEVTSLASSKPTIHSVRLIGWGMQDGKQYWHAANSWGKTWNTDGTFKILRGTDFCQIERTVCHIQPAAYRAKKTQDTMSQRPIGPMPERLVEMSVDLPGAWVQQDNTTQPGVIQAADHLKASTEASGLTGHVVSTVHTQAVAGLNYHITMNATDASGNPVVLYASVHRNLNGEHSMLSNVTVAVASSGSSLHVGVNSAIFFVVCFSAGTATGTLMFKLWR